MPPHHDSNMSGSRKKSYDTLKAPIKTQQYRSAVIEDSRRNILTESTAVLNRWTEYYGGLYNYVSLLQSNQSPIREAEGLPALKERLKKLSAV